MVVYKIKTIPSKDTDLKSCLRLATIDVLINVVIQHDIDQLSTLKTKHEYFQSFFINKE